MKCPPSRICQTSLVVVCLFVMTLVCYPNIASAAGAVQSDLTVIDDVIVFDAHADGTSTTVQTKSVRIDTSKGLKEGGQASLRYSTTLEVVEVIAAYTTTRDGTRIDVKPDAIRTQQSPESVGAPMFEDEQVKKIVFPGVEVGSIVTYKTRRTLHTALFPGYVSASFYFSDDRTIESVHVTVHAPPGMNLLVDVAGLDGGATATNAEGEQTWTWSIEGRQARPFEMGSPDRFDHSPRVVVSSFPNYQAVGAAYLERARPKAAITPAIQALAEQITSGMTGHRAQAEALYRWVSTNIRYVAIHLGFGSVVPHAAEDTLNARYGDCKDHVTLLEALLKAKGIDSSPVLVNGTRRYSLPTASDPLAVFDHAITYLPEFGLFVDSTSGMGMFGTLPFQELGKPALIVDDGAGRATITRLPMSNPAGDGMMVQTTIKVDDQGTAKGSSIVKTSGAYDLIARSVFTMVAPGDVPVMAARMLATNGQIGSGDFAHDDVRDLDHAFQYSMHFVLPDYAHLPGPGAMRVPAGLATFNGISATFDLFGPTTRELPLTFFSRHVIERTDIQIPSGLKIESLPNPVRITSSFGSYTSTYEKDRENIVVTRTLDLDVPNVLVTPQQYPELREMAMKVKRDLASQLVY
jgi:transglutaminase-like putative cysteine protease